MAGRIPAWGNFNIPSAVFDMHEWMADELIDGEIGSTCTLVFPAHRAACDNCLFDPNTNRSSNIYRTSAVLSLALGGVGVTVGGIGITTETPSVAGPIPFANHMMCPRCNGVGFAAVPQTSSIRLRIYWEPSTWRHIGIKVGDPTGLCVVIGYMTDNPEFERADTVLLNDELKGIRNYHAAREGESQPWGFRRNRYFAQLMRRTGGG